MSIYCTSFCSHLTAKKACIKAQKWLKLRYKAPYDNATKVKASLL